MVAVRQGGLAGLCGNEGRIGALARGPVWGGRDERTSATNQ